MSNEFSALTIGRLARRAGVGVETIRFYERKRLISKPRRPERGFRIYPDDTAQRIRFIRHAQELGFTLREIRDLLSLQADPVADCSRVRQRAAVKLDEVVGKIDHLRRIEGALKTLVAACPGRGATRICSILEAIEDDTVESSRSKAVTPARASSVKTLKLKIEGMHCEACAGTIKAVLEAESGVQGSIVAFKTRRADITFDPDSIDEARIMAAIERTGFRASPRRP